MDGLDGTDEKLAKALIEKKEEYPCVWYSKIKCPIRTQWKLTPENLTPWCAVCKSIGYLDEQKEGMRP